MADETELPAEGLREVLRYWSGKGVLKGLARLEDTSERRWSLQDVERRAARVLIERLKALPSPSPLLKRLPTRMRDWQDAIPASVHAERWTSERPRPGIAWGETLKLFGWPPSRFSGRTRWRIHDRSLLRPAAWIAHELLRALERAEAVFKEVGAGAEEQLDVLREITTWKPFVAEQGGSRPNAEELRLMQSEGRPWRDLAAIGRELIRFEESFEALASELLWPDEEMAWRLFHLSVFGDVLLGVRDAGLDVVSIRPIGDSSGGPCCIGELGPARVEIWFEAAGVWAATKKRSPYSQAASGVTGTRALGADVALFDSAGGALLIECKFYRGNGEGAARDGFLQAVTYAAETKAVLADRVIAAVVLPSEQVRHIGWTNLPSGRVCIAPQAAVRRLAEEFITSPK